MPALRLDARKHVSWKALWRFQRSRTDAFEPRISRIGADSQSQNQPTEPIANWRTNYQLPTTNYQLPPAVSRPHPRRAASISSTTTRQRTIPASSPKDTLRSVALTSSRASPAETLTNRSTSSSTNSTACCASAHGRERTAGTIGRTAPNFGTGSLQREQPHQCQRRTNRIARKKSCRKA